MRDVVTNLFSRLGAVGLSLIAGALIFGALAGVVVVHRLQIAQLAASSGQGQRSDQEQRSEQDQRNEQGTKNHGQSKTKHPNQGRGQAPETSDHKGEQDKDA